MKDIFLKVMFYIRKIWMNFMMIYPFWLKKWKIKKVEKRVANLRDENTIHNRNFKKH